MNKVKPFEIDIQNWKNYRLIMKNYDPQMKYQYIDFERQTSVKSYYKGLIHESRVVNCQIEQIFENVYGKPKEGFIIVVQDQCDKKNPFICAKACILLKELYFNGKLQKIAQIQDLNVKKSHRRLGLAKKVCNQVEKCLKENFPDYKLIFCEIPDSQGFISQFFKEQGFQNIDSVGIGCFSRWKKYLLNVENQQLKNSDKVLEGLEFQSYQINENNKIEIQNYINQFITQNPPPNFYPDLIKEYSNNPTSEGFYVFKQNNQIVGILQLLKGQQLYSVLPTKFIGLRFGLFKDKKHYYWTRWLLTIIMVSILIICFILQRVGLGFKDHQYLQYLQYFNIFNSKFLGLYFTICTLINLKFFRELKKLLNKDKQCLNIAMLHVQGQNIKENLQSILNFAQQKGKQLNCGSLVFPVDQQSNILKLVLKKSGFNEFPMRQNCVIQRKMVYKDLNKNPEKNNQEYWGNFFIDVRDL